MSDTTKRERIEEFLRKSLLGEELVNTQFHLFSAKSSPSGRVSKPRVLCANSVLLAKSSKYFLDLLSSDINPSDPSLTDLTGDNDVPSDARVDDYGYASDSDLDDYDDPILVANNAPSDQSATLLAPSSKNGTRTRSKDDDELSEDGSESDRSDMFVMSTEQPGKDELYSVNKTGSMASSETVVQEPDNKTSPNQTAMRLRSLGSRHILVKDTAFQTWYTLLNYLYTDECDFLPLSSATPGGQPRESSTSALDGPKCSAKSMYRLACKIGLDHLRNEAFSYIEHNLTEHNILQEVSSSLVSKHPQLLEMELDMLYYHITAPPVVANFPALAKRIANKELSHGADIIVGIHARILRTHQLVSWKPAAPSLSSKPLESGTPVTRSDTPEANAAGGTGPSVDTRPILSLPSHPPKSNGIVPSMKPQVGPKVTGNPTIPITSLKATSIFLPPAGEMGQAKGQQTDGTRATKSIFSMI